MIRRIAALCFALGLFALPAHAQTRTWIGHGTWAGYGVVNPISGGDFLYPYIVDFPNCFQTFSGTAQPWDPNGAATDYWVEATNGATCSGVGQNPGQGIYYNLPKPHRALGIVMWIKLNGNITSSTFITRFNDCTNGGSTGVYRGCVDYAATQVSTANKIFSDITGAGTTSAALTVGTWYQYEWCYIAGINGSGTVPAQEKAWLNQTQFINNTTAATTQFAYGGSGITIDYELGAGGSMDFGPFAVYDSGTSCPTNALATMYVVTGQPTSNGTPLNFTAQANTNWQNAAAPTPGSLSYNFDAAAGDTDVYNLTLGTGSNVLFVAQRASVEKTSGGTRIARLGWNISGTTYPCVFDNGFSLGGDTLPQQIANALQVGTYQQVGCLSDTDPSTSAPWSGITDASHISATVQR